MGRLIKVTSESSCPRNSFQLHTHYMVAPALPPCHTQQNMRLLRATDGHNQTSRTSRRASTPTVFTLGHRTRQAKCPPCPMTRLARTMTRHSPTNTHNSQTHTATTMNKRLRHCRVQRMGTVPDTITARFHQLHTRAMTIPVTSIAATTMPTYSHTCSQQTWLPATTIGATPLIISLSNNRWTRPCSRHSVRRRQWGISLIRLQILMAA